MPAWERSFAASTSRTHASSLRALPTGTNVPTIDRTIVYKNPSASISR